MCIRDRYSTIADTPQAISRHSSASPIFFMLCTSFFHSIAQVDSDRYMKYDMAKCYDFRFLESHTPLLMYALFDGTPVGYTAISVIYQ